MLETEQGCYTLYRQINIDYQVASSLSSSDGLSECVISYDIACQWSKHVLDRFTKLPDGIADAALSMTLYFVVPKLHLRSHKIDCQGNFSFNNLVGVGRTDGEGVERNWSSNNDAAGATREMREGHRHDTLDDVFHDYNYRKITDLGESNT